VRPGPKTGCNALPLSSVKLNSKLKFWSICYNERKNI
jgi:hypothetical protein